MPNWCENTVIITGPSKWINTFKRKVRSKDAVLDFYKLIPYPKDVLKAPYDPVQYDWEVNNWGCKWGANNPHLSETRIGRKKKRLVYNFDTAWAPALGFFVKSSKLFKKLEFSMFNNEPGCNYIGYDKAKSGVLIHSKVADYPSPPDGQEEFHDDEETECIRSWYENASTTENERLYWRSR